MYLFCYFRIKYSYDCDIEGEVIIQSKKFQTLKARIRNKCTRKKLKVSMGKELGGLDLFNFQHTDIDHQLHQLGAIEL